MISPVVRILWHLGAMGRSYLFLLLFHLSGVNLDIWGEVSTFVPLPTNSSQFPHGTFSFTHAQFQGLVTACGQQGPDWLASRALKLQTSSLLSLGIYRDLQAPWREGIFSSCWHIQAPGSVFIMMSPDFFKGVGALLLAPRWGLIFKGLFWFHPQFWMHVTHGNREAPGSWQLCFVSTRLSWEVGGEGVGHRMRNDGQVTGRPSSANLIRLVNHNTLWGARDSPSELSPGKVKGGGQN